MRMAESLMAGRERKTSNAAADEGIQAPIPNVRAFDAALDAVGMTRATLSRRFPYGGPNVVQKIIAGERRCQIAEAIWLASQLRVTFARTVKMLGYDIDDSAGLTVPIVGTVTSTSRVITGRERELVPAPPGSTVETLAARIEADSPKLMLCDGTIIFWTPAPAYRVRPDAFGRLSVVTIGEDQSAVVGVLGRARLGEGAVTLLDGKVLNSTQIMAAYPVEWKRNT